ncbi:MAG: hypothetical protein QOD75_610 [Blastocatellia bacterium]|jgi:hypothetical protein|nr:hypothetical protein [Blastocatellia bacterium]
MKFPATNVRQPLLREFLIFLAFIGLTAIMTWPWVLHLRDAVPDAGDPYAISYLMWWDYHQTFHDPLNLFHATFFYPYRYTLAFGEFDYGVSLIFFPLFALGVRPLTVYSLAAFLSFPFTGYATFRLARTLSGSRGIAWVAGIIIAFLPFRFHHLSHLHLIFAGWIPLVFEALVLFARRRSWPRAVWLGFAFLMNGLTCTTWLILTILPLTISGSMLLTRYSAWKDRKFWLRAGITLAGACLLLLPFLLPLRRVAAEHGFSRSAEEVMHYSARPINWLTSDERTKVWRGFGAAGLDTEMVLFPGLLAPLLALAAFLIAKPGAIRRDEPPETSSRKWIMLAALDGAAVLAGVVVILTLGFNVFRLRPFGMTLMTAKEPDHALFVLLLVLVTRCLIAYPSVVRTALSGDRNLAETVRSPRRSELFGHALVWTIIGFAGSFGLNFFFYRFLYEFIPVFKGMRVATRWGMICYVGLALLAGLGAKRLAEAMTGRWPQFGRAATYGVLVVAILFELHAAPLKMMRGEINPDELTLFLKHQKMSGGILELPIGDSDHVYMLRAADHGHPIVNGSYSFVPALQREIRQLSNSEPITDQFLDLLETNKVSYIAVHNSLIGVETRTELEDFFKRGVASGRLKFIKSFPPSPREAQERTGQRNDLYAVMKIAPDAASVELR